MLQTHRSSPVPVLGVALVLLVAPDGAADCPDEPAVAAYVAEFAGGLRSAGFGGVRDLAEAQCARARLIEALPGVQGALVGYKASFTNPVIQQRVGVTEPAWGAMFSREMRQSGDRVPARFGAYPQFEADLVAVVRDPGLADARTPLEALGHLTELVPFIELPDRMLTGRPDGKALIATNIAFRGGVLGEGVRVEPTPAFLDGLAGMTVVLTEERTGRELGRVQGAVLMGNPIHAALWLARALKRDGVALRAGDLLSLGGFFPPAEVVPGTRIKVQYLGLPGDPAVTVSFE